MLFVPVVDSNQIPLMPTIPARARRWIELGKATGFFKKGVFCVRLNQEPSDRKTQSVVVGIDPGSKKEGLTVKSASHTYLNILADAVTHVKRAVEERRDARKARRQRKTPYRPNRRNRARGGIPPSTKARWQWKLRLIQWLKKMFPITDVVVEDIKAVTKGKPRWDQMFSPLEVGKQWFYGEVQKIASLFTLQGHETKGWRDLLGLKKTTKKMAEVFGSHCVDSWVLANALAGGHIKPDNTRMLAVTPLILHRRELYKKRPRKGGVRSPYGGTRSMGLKRGSIVKHLRYGVCYVGGAPRKRVSLHSLETGNRLCMNADPLQIKFLTYSTWRSRTIPVTTL